MAFWRIKYRSEPPKLPTEIEAELHFQRDNYDHFVLNGTPDTRDSDLLIRSSLIESVKQVNPDF